MKKIIFTTVTFLFFASITSCSDSDDNASLEGKWEYSKEGYAENGQEFLEDYEHQEGCTKDYSIITSTTVIDHNFSGPECEEDIFTIPYTRNGNTITISVEGETFSSQIKKLDSNTLKIYSIDPDFPDEAEVTVFKRVN